jgi:hypothetical protein
MAELQVPEKKRSPKQICLDCVAYVSNQAIGTGSTIAIALVYGAQMNERKPRFLSCLGV